MFIEKLETMESWRSVASLTKTIDKIVKEIGGSAKPMDMERFVEENELYPPEFGIEVKGYTSPDEDYPPGTKWRIQIVVDDTGVRRNVFVNAIGTKKVPVNAGIKRRDHVIRRLLEAERSRRPI